MGKLFGTDGVRGLVNKDLTSELALKLGASIAKIRKQKLKKEHLTFVIGSDTRKSKDMLSFAVIAGILSEGDNIIDVGVLPTPAISYLITKYQLDGGIVISASHNPSEYNGIKVLNEKGYKLSEKEEEEIEEEVLHIGWNANINEVGTYERKPNAKEEYIDYLCSTIKNPITDIKILVDTANGAASVTAPLLFDKLKANYTLINANPDGLNINANAGSTHIDVLQEKVREGYDLGIAYDGDADRCILVDEKGRVIDGDYILAIAGLYKKEKGLLPKNTIVGTVMSNLGFIKCCEKNSINVIKTKVGDKYVLEEMLKEDYTLGGEQSGHIIFKELATTGDGELTSLQILNILSEKHEKLSVLADAMEKYPQVLINVETTPKGKEDYLENTKIQSEIKRIEEILKDDGRILVRASGTENLIRIMIEGKNTEEIETLAKGLERIMKMELDEKN